MSSFPINSDGALPAGANSKSEKRNIGPRPAAIDLRITKLTITRTDNGSFTIETVANWAIGDRGFPAVSSVEGITVTELDKSIADLFDKVAETLYNATTKSQKS